MMPTPTYFDRRLTPFPTDEYPPVIIEFPHRTAGDGKIEMSGFSPFHSNIRILDQWSTDSYGNGIRVYAGGETSDAGGFVLPRPWQGLIVVDTDGKWDYYHTPYAAGLVRIVDAQGMQLIL